MKLGKKEITPYGNEMFFVLEAGTNYYELADYYGMSIKKTAKSMIELAAKAGADAIKFQTYKAERIASKSGARAQYDYFRRHDAFDYKDYRELFEHCIKNDIEFMTTLFDIDDVDRFDQILNVYKIASPDITNFPLIEKIALKRKPIILSTGGATTEEIVKTLEFIDGACPVVITHCVPNYGGSSMNYEEFMQLREEFPDKILGYSDHTAYQGTLHQSAIEVAYIAGARVIEKHFTIPVSGMYDNLRSNDNYHSIGGMATKCFVDEIQEFNKRHAVSEDDRQSIFALRNSGRRKIYSAKFIPEGKVIEKDDLIMLRGYGGLEVSLENLSNIVGHRAIYDIEPDNIILRSSVENSEES